MEYSDGESINRWWAAPKTEVARELVSVVDDLQTNQLGRRQQALNQLSSYHGCNVNDLGPGYYNAAYTPKEDANLNVIRRIVDTAVAKIASKQRPKAQVLTKGADYRLRLTARKLSKFLEAQLYQQQGCYATSWDLAEQLFKDACIWTAGVCKVLPDFGKGKIAHERVYPWDLFVDDYDAEYGSPQNLFHVYRYDKHVLAARFPKYRHAIMGASEYNDLVTGGDYRRKYDSCAVYEGWRLPPGRKPNGELIPGRWTIAIKGPDGECVALEDRDWKRQSFPLIWMRWKRNSSGVWGMSLVDEIVTAQEMLTEMFNWVSESMELMSSGKVLYEEANADSAEQMKGNGPWEFHRVNDINGIKVFQPPPVNPALTQWLETLRGIPYELSGINELTSQGKKEAGITAGVALRTINDMQSELFLPQSHNYETFFVELARRDLDAAQDLVDNNVDLELALPSEGFLEDIKFKDVTMPSDMYKVTIQPSNSGEDSLAGRRQMVAELAQGGQLSPSIVERLLTTPNPDLESMASARQSQYRYLASMIGEFMEYDAEHEAAEGEDEVDEIYEAPEKYMNLEDGIRQMTQAYYEMKEMRAPEENLRLARNWIDQADGLIQERDAAAQPGAGVPGGAVPAPPMPPEGMPPGGGGEPMGPPQLAGANIPPEMMPAA